MASFLSSYLLNIADLGPKSAGYAVGFIKMLSYFFNFNKYLENFYLYD